MPGTTSRTRDEVTSRWQAVSRGEVSRENLSVWTEPLMFAKFGSPPDIVVMQALQFNHGFDMTYRSSDERVMGHGPPWRYVFTLEEVLAEFQGLARTVYGL